METTQPVLLSEVTFTQDDANHLLTMLSDLPIRYLSIVQNIQAWLNQKFVAPPAE